MNVLQLKIFVSNLSKIKIRNIYLSLFSAGRRGEDSIVVPVGNLHYSLGKNTRINIVKGSAVCKHRFHRTKSLCWGIKNE